MQLPFLFPFPDKRLQIKGFNGEIAEIVAGCPYMRHVRLQKASVGGGSAEQNESYSSSSYTKKINASDWWHVLWYPTRKRCVTMMYRLTWLSYTSIPLN